MSRNVKLYFISTPIGNIKDITLRALEVFKIIDYIFVEDTRITNKLLNYYNISKPLFIYNKDNEKVSSDKIIDLIQQGKIIGVASDAGTPGISDPGNLLVKELIRLNIPFEILPGATAFVLALIYSGFDTSSFYFKGFLNNKKGARLKELDSLHEINGTIILYESCHRIKQTIYDLFDFFNPPFFICRELTKLYEEHIYINDKNEINNITEKGEFIIVFENHREMKYDEHSFIDITTKLKKENFPNKDILKILKIIGCKRNIAYKIIEDI
jgi:16S rRNA (cytidine1402-2'-O)-methyltransferase